jgi:lipid II isoglutaminyl synthase (glutamine-hydrolysing)
MTLRVASRHQMEFSGPSLTQGTSLSGPTHAGRRAGLARSLDSLTLAAARMAGRAIRATSLGAGTSLPGRLAARVRPGLLERRAHALGDGVVVVSGTNGKTTTAAMITAILREVGVAVIANSSGANMLGGVVGAFVQAPRDGSVAVLEVDEGVLPVLVQKLRPRALVLTNIFRDQLDRFGEPERVASLLAATVDRLPPGTPVIANADDPLLWHSIEHAHPTGFSLVLPGPDTPRGEASDREGTVSDGEPATCPACGTNLAYALRTFAHLGSARCPSCDWASPRPSLEGRVIAQAGLQGFVMEVDGSVLTVPLGGLHNAYNALAALCAADALGVPRTVVISALERFHPKFGRAEEFIVDDRRVWLALIKNPAGAGAITQAVAGDRAIGAVVISVNDHDADGRDVSWIWDADFEPLVRAGLPTVACGRRAEEVAVRLKYAGTKDVQIERDPSRAIAAAARRAPTGASVAVLATYTAMLDVRQSLLGSRAARVVDRDPRNDLAA